MQHLTPHHAFVHGGFAHRGYFKTPSGIRPEADELDDELDTALGLGPSERVLKQPLILCLFLLHGLLPGCSQDIRDMTPTDKARMTTELREEAKACRVRYQDSDFTDVEALECLTENYRRTTEFFPSPLSCRICYYRYAEGLHLLGIYYWERRDALRGGLKDAEGSQDPDRESRITELDALVKEYFAQSNEVIEAYLSSGLEDPVLYDWASEHAAELGQYGKARRYVTRLLQSQKFNEDDRRKLEKRRRAFKVLYDQQQRERMRQSSDKRRRAQTEDVGTRSDTESGDFTEN